MSDTDRRPRTANPAPFVDAITEYLEPHREQFNYDAMRHTFLDNDRFHRWAAQVDRHHPVEGSRFLSSGCGMGGSLLAYHDAGAASVTGVEVDPLYVRMATLRTADLADASVQQVPPDPPLPFEDGRFDLIESMDVIEHVPDPRAYLAELLRVLAPSGLILVVTPNRLWPVEQHLGIAGPPWLPVGFADRVFAAAARLPGLSDERRFKFRELADIRTQNMSLRRLRGLAVDLDLHLEVLVRSDDGEAAFPLPADQPRAEAMMRSRWGKFVSPLKTLAVTLQPR
ncbi:class I SAM-dependent methyltransferase [Euzebya tangerina]|uniref:class I SAM-dependent methyltransferase n=1 Tax=Euzebya tangerina TaxID=591198 RepID=UPI000E30F957|nr:methyltransferase domain-containing protein [Euzebya tangerina]